MGETTGNNPIASTKDRSSRKVVDERLRAGDNAIRKEGVIQPNG